MNISVSVRFKCDFCEKIENRDIPYKDLKTNNIERCLSGWFKDKNGEQLACSLECRNKHSERGVPAEWESL